MNDIVEERYNRVFLFMSITLLFVGLSTIYLGIRYHPCPMVGPASPNSTLDTNCLTLIHYNPFTNLGNLSAIIGGIILIIIAIISIRRSIYLLRNGKNNGGKKNE